MTSGDLPSETPGSGGLDAFRARMRELAASSDDPVAWFDQLYAEAAGEAERVPWADLEPNPNLVVWLERAQPVPGRTLVVGCGLGDDAEHLADLGHDVTAFDVSETAVAWARERWPDSSVDYVAADLLDPPAAWAGAFDLVVEIYTLQVLPTEPRERAATNLATFVAPGGTLLVICRGTDDPVWAGPPWPLTREELGAIDLPIASFEDFTDPDGETRRFRVTYRRPT